MFSLHKNKAWLRGKNRITHPHPDPGVTIKLSTTIDKNDKTLGLKELFVFLASKFISFV